MLCIFYHARLPPSPPLTASTSYVCIAFFMLGSVRIEVIAWFPLVIQAGTEVRKLIVSLCLTLCWPLACLPCFR